MKSAMSKRVAALVMAASVMGSTAVQAAEVKKDESVYVNLNSNGSTEKTIVSDWIHSDSENITVYDKSELKNIKNVKDDVEPEKNGENLIWDMEGSNLYYQGNTDKDIPLDISVKYYYDDEEIEPEDLAGKSGKVRIEIDVKNKEYKDVEINGKSRRIYTPFLVAGGVTLPNGKFSEVTTEGGTMVSEGNNILVAFAKMPGLKESLELDSIPYDKASEMEDKLSIINDKKITIEAEAEEFSLGPIMITATPDTSMLGDLSQSTDLTEFKDKLNLLQSSYEQILDGETQISDGIVNGYADAKAKMAEGLPKIQGILSLVQDDSKLNRSRRLLSDAEKARAMDTNLLRNNLSKLGSEDLSNQVNSGIYLLEKLDEMKKSNQLNELKDKYILLKQMDESGQLGKLKSGYSMLNGMKKSGELEQLINGGKIILDSYDNINKMSKSAVGILNNKKTMGELNLLLNDISSMEKDYDSLKPETKQVIKLLSSTITVENIKKAEETAGQLTEVQQTLKTAINNAGGTDKFILGLRQSLDTLSSLSKVDFSSIKTDVNNYGSAYLILRSELMYAKSTGNLEAKKTELKNIVSGVYSENPELVKQLTKAVDGFSTNLSKEGITTDCIKAANNSNTLESLSTGVQTLKAAAPLLNQLNTLTSDSQKLNSVLSILTGDNEVINNLNNLALAIKSLPADQQATLINVVGNMGNVMNHIDSNKENIEMIKGLIGDKGLSEQEIKKINEYANQIAQAEGTVEKLKKLNISTVEIPDIDMSKIDVPNIDLSMLNKIEGINIDMNSVKSIAANKDNLLIMGKDLVAMQDDLRIDGDILNIMNESLKQGNVDEARRLINDLPSYESKIDELNTGIQKLSDGMKQYKEQAIDELYNKGNDGLNVIDEISLVKDEMVNSSKEFGCFSGKDDNLDGTTKFIMKTKEIKYEPPVEDEDNNQTTEKKGFFAWIKSILGLD